MIAVNRAKIDAFLSGKRIAVIGVSRNPRDYSRMLFRELLKHGYDAIPVNPAAEEIEGRTCFKSIKDITPPPDRAVIILPNSKTERAVLDCADAGVRDLWLYPFSKSDTRILTSAQQKRLNLITGYCMFMFLPKPSFVHRLHGGILKLVGAYPR